MNAWLLSAGLLCAATCLIHTFAGQSLVREFLDTAMPRLVKSTLFACWHLVTVTLCLSAVALLLMAWRAGLRSSGMLIFIGALYLGFGLVFLVIGGCFYRGRGWLKLPQWVLLGPIGVLTVLGL